MDNHEKHKIEYYICDENNNDSRQGFCYFLKGQVVDRFVLFYVYLYLYLHCFLLSFRGSRKVLTRVLNPKYLRPKLSTRYLQITKRT